MTLPTPTVNRARQFDGQVFCHSLAGEALWRWRLAGFEARDTGIGAATGGVASVQVARAAGASPGQVTSHSSDILFDLVTLSGSVTLTGDGQGAHPLTEGDAFVIPPHLKTSLTAASRDLQLLEVWRLPADFDTSTHPDVRLP